MAENDGVFVDSATAASSVSVSSDPSTVAADDQSQPREGQNSTPGGDDDLLGAMDSKFSKSVKGSPIEMEGNVGERESGARARSTGVSHHSSNDELMKPSSLAAGGNNNNIQPPWHDAAPLTGREKWNLVLCLLAWACTICNVTLVIGTSALVVLSIEGDISISSIPLGVFFFGASLISLTVTPWLFDALGRKGGFLVGVFIGLIGSGLGGYSVWKESPPLMIVSTGLFGASTGIGFYWRFAVLEVVPTAWSDRALALVVSGGCLAAIAGPESAEATRTMFGESLDHMGVYFMTALFCLFNLVLTSNVKFRPQPHHHNNTQEVQPKVQQQEQEEDPEESGPHARELIPVHPLRVTGDELARLLATRQFVVPMLLASFAWAIMAVPMTLVRVAMEQVGYSSETTLRVMELHFLAMYGSGFFTGTLIRRFGSRVVTWTGCGLFALSLMTLSMADTEEDADGGFGMWCLGMIFSGCGWGLTFTSATSWLTALYRASPEAKSSIQAANDFCFFMLSGVWVFSASYIYDAGGAGLDGWRTLLGAVVGLLAALVMVLLLDQHLEDQLRNSENGGDGLAGSDRPLEDHSASAMV